MHKTLDLKSLETVTQCEQNQKYFISNCCSNKIFLYKLNHTLSRVPKTFHKVSL